jgi:hypothetical protein
MDREAGQLDKLMELDARHDDLLRRLEDLDRRVRNVLAQYRPPDAMPRADEEAAIVAGPDGPIC